MKIGLNGFGRIGKCCFLQMLTNKNIQICCINAINVTINDLEDYLKYDSVHKKYDCNFAIEIISYNKFKINDQIIFFVSDRNATNIKWKDYQCEYVIDATGSYLTKEKCLQHDVEYVIMSAPAKDNTPTYIYGVNDCNYRGENIISGSSCTTNCLAPMLKILDDEYGITSCVFTTIHSLTASQYVTDNGHSKTRTNRCGLNNIIPSTTGASASISTVLPNIKNVYGTSLRVPTTNVSIVDANIEVTNKNIKLQDIVNLLANNKYYGIVYDITTKKLVSCDFLTTTTPTILDVGASIDMGNGKFKLMIWYDNEWSYSAQLIRLVEKMYQFNKTNKINRLDKKYYIENINMINKIVLCRCDFNVPIIDDFRSNSKIVSDDFRITSAIPTIKYICDAKPKCVILASHFGRPTCKDTKNSLKQIIPYLEKYLNSPIIFLDGGICSNTIDIINNNVVMGQIYLLENLRFHEEETTYETMADNEINTNATIQMYNSLADVYINDAFGCCHRKHMSICPIIQTNKSYGFGMLINNEVNMLSSIFDNTKKKLAIFGGNKIADKLPIINTINNIYNTKIFVGGGLASQYKDINNNCVIMSDGYGNVNTNENPIYIDDINNTNNNMNIYDIGDKSLDILYSMIDDTNIIFWNGPMGIIENNMYIKGSLKILEYLKKQTNKTILVGGGETASLIHKYLLTDDNNIKKMFQVSTGGGAMIEFIEKINCGKQLVGLSMFTKKQYV